MLERHIITKAGEAEPALDQKRLYAAGLDHVRRLAQLVWTDHNVHDPGITTLELLCYALTDLGYRASFPVEDLLAGADPAHQVLFTAAEILPNRPLTRLDYRKLLIDLKKVKNAWILDAEQVWWADPVEEKLRWDRSRPDQREVRVRGLYKVLVELMEGVPPEEEGEVLGDVMATLHAHRNLCEDFLSAAVVPRESFLLCAELELAPDADVARVEAEVMFQVGQYLSPPVGAWSLSEMLERRKPDGTPYAVHEIFDGPLLKHGFIDDAELVRADLRTNIRLSDVINVVMEIEGVRAVVDLIINPESARAPLANKWVVPVPAGRQPYLNRDRSRLVCYRRGMPVQAARERVEELYAALAEQVRLKLETPGILDLPVPRGRDRQPGRYHSFQNHFPEVYGLSWSGLPSGAGPKRQAQALQLKAYLFFFDQIMADYCAQLARVKDLFSIDPDLDQSYFYQAVDSFADFERIYTAEEALAELEEDQEQISAERLSRFLDHLVARFAERFHDYARIMIDSFGAGAGNLLGVKRDFLRRLPVLGAGRGLGYDQTGELWNTDNVSGLERRVAALLGMPDARRGNLGALALDSFVEVDTTPGGEYVFRVRHRETGRILLSSRTKRDSADQAWKEAENALRLAQRPAGYDRRRSRDEKRYFNVVAETGEVVARRIQYFESDAERDAAIDGVMAYVREHYSDEGMLLIENILLRPGPEDDAFLPICADPGCKDCADDDPYSYRVHIVLPAYAGRFTNMDFRRFAEEVIRQETPAHVLPKICWVDRDDMERLETSYRAWLEAKAGGTASGEKLAALAKVLYEVKNVYPSQRLAECDGGEERPKFILGRTALGSVETPDGSD